jgi:hypothetical protein
MRHAFSRRSRRVEKVRNGSTEERVFVSSHFPFCPVRFGGGLGARAQVFGQPVEIGLALQHHRQVLFVRELVLAEGGEELRQLLVERGELRLLRLVEVRALAREARVVDVGQALLLGGEPGFRARVVHRPDAAEERSRSA